MTSIWNLEASTSDRHCSASLSFVPRGTPICRQPPLCNHGREDFWFYLREGAWAPRLCFACHPASSWHVPVPGAPTPGYRQLALITQSSVTSRIGRTTSRQWKRSSTISPTCGLRRPRSQVVGNCHREGHRSSRKPPFAGFSNSVDTRLAATIASHLRGSLL